MLSFDDPSKTFQGCDKRNIWGTNNKLPSMFRRSFQSQLIVVTFFVKFFKKIFLLQAQENDCYGRASLVSVIKCTRENGDLFKT